MTDQSTTVGAPEGPVARPPQAAMTVEIVMDTYRVTGDLHSMSGPRRLVDILNGSDEPFIVVHAGALDDPLVEGDEPRRFDVLHIHRETILFAIPRSVSEVDPDPFQIVKKVPLAATITLPGFELSGNVFLLPETDPADYHWLTSRHFIPMTDVSVKAVTRAEPVWREPLLAVNLSGLRLFAPRPA